MKTLLTALIVCFGTVLPHAHAQQVDAAPAVSSTDFKKKKNYGGLDPGKSFKLEAGEPVIIKGSNPFDSKRIKKAPKGVPNFKEGKKIKFKIGKKGELTGPGFKMKLDRKSISDVSNLYTSGLDPKNSSIQPSTAIVYKNFKGKPTGIALSFYKVQVKGTTPTVYTVNYLFGDLIN